MEAEKFEIKPEPVVIETLTPIWTGGVNGKSSAVKETGVIGSMRWWYETIVRGMKRYACNPISNDKCMLNGKENHDERFSKLCPVCYLFGCGGWKRRFRLEIVDAKETVPFHLSTLDRDKVGNNWWLSKIFENNRKDNLFFGKSIFNIYLVGKDNGSEIIKQIRALLSIMSHVGAIGAKNQYGFGQFEMKGKMEFQEAMQEINNFITKFKEGTNNPEFYSLSNFWCYEFKIPAKNQLVQKLQKSKNIIGNKPSSIRYLPNSFDIRYKLQNNNNDSGLRRAYYIHCNGDKEKIRKIFGTLLDNEKRGSRIFVSHLYKERIEEDQYFLRVWGFTEKDVGELMGAEIKKMFSLKEVPEMKYKKEINDFLGGA